MCRLTVSLFQDENIENAKPKSYKIDCDVYCCSFKVIYVTLNTHNPHWGTSHDFFRLPKTRSPEKTTPNANDMMEV